MQKPVTPRWTSFATLVVRAARQARFLGTILLLATVLTPPASEAQEGTRPLVGDLGLVLTPGSALGYWDLSRGGNSEGPFVEIERFELDSRIDFEGTRVEELLAAVLVGHLPDAGVFVAGVIGQPDPAGRSFLVFAERASRAEADKEARTFVDAYNSYLLQETFPTPLCDCEDCGSILVEEQNICGGIQNACLGEAVAAGIACAAICLGNPVCELACAAAVVFGIFRCGGEGAICRRGALSRFVQCEANCNN